MTDWGKALIWPAAIILGALLWACIILAYLAYAGLLVDRDPHEEYRTSDPIVGAPYDWYPMDQTDPQAWMTGPSTRRHRTLPTRGWGNEPVRLFYG